MTPRETNLDAQDTFTLRCSFDVKIKVGPAKQMFEATTAGFAPTSLKTRQRDAVRIVERRVHRILDNARGELAEREIEFVGDSIRQESICLEVEPYDRTWCDHRGRIFQSCVFLGLGDYSTRDIGILKARLDHAFSVLGGLQQMPFENDYEDEDRYVENVAHDIFTALTGREAFRTVIRTDNWQQEGF